MDTTDSSYDVIICGAGLAGLTLAHQLSLQLPHLKVVLLDREKRPLPEAAHKVGESTVHPGGTYLCNVLGLKDYLDENHLEKYGLRYYFGKGDQDFHQRAELGRAVYDPAILEHQLDRGILENDLRGLIENSATLLEGAMLTDIDLKPGEKHLVKYRLEGEDCELSASWVIDATGRRQFLSRKLNLRREFDENCSSSWLRVKGRFDIADLVSSKNEFWHNRVSGEHPFLEDFSRYNSTNHIMGYGYWVWIIPLVSGHTSIGVVTHNSYHPFSTHNTFEKTVAWLQEHEPILADHLEGFEVLDFKVMANYAHTATQVFSEDRWACTGESGVFSDPFQSPGTDSIAIANCYIKELIHADVKGTLTPGLVKGLNSEFLDYSRTLTHIIQSSYPAFTDRTVGTISIMWYLGWTMSFIVPNMRFRIYKDGHISDEGSLDDQSFKHIGAINALGVRVAHLIRDWALLRKEESRQGGFTWLHHWEVPFFAKFRERMLNQNGPEWEGNLQMLSNFAAAIFLYAIEDIYPKEAMKFETGFVPNVLYLSMNPEGWDERLFKAEGNWADEGCYEVKADMDAVFLKVGEEV